MRSWDKWRISRRSGRGGGREYSGTDYNMRPYMCNFLEIMCEEHKNKFSSRMKMYWNQSGYKQFITTKWIKSWSYTMSMNYNVILFFWATLFVPKLESALEYHIYLQVISCTLPIHSSNYRTLNNATEDSYWYQLHGWTLVGVFFGNIILETN